MIPLGQGHTPDTSDLFSETLRLLQLREEEDDATSKLAELAFVNAPKPEQVELQQTDGGVVQGDGQPATFFQEVNIIFEDFSLFAVFLCVLFSFLEHP